MSGIASNNQDSKQMPVGGVYKYGSSKGKPASQSSIKEGEDLRANKKGK